MVQLVRGDGEDVSDLAECGGGGGEPFTSSASKHRETHVLQLEEASGLPRWVQHVFGRFYTPQGSLPGWFVEGLAVMEESRHTSAGRVRATMFEM